MKMFAIGAAFISDLIKLKTILLSEAIDLDHLLDQHLVYITLVYLTSSFSKN